MDITLHTTNLNQFRTSLYQNFKNRADTLLELIDAMCSYPAAKSVVEYTLASCYRRSYTTLFKAVDELALPTLWLPQQLAPYLPHPRARPFWLLLVDVTPYPRLYAQTLQDRGMVYQPEVVQDKLPVTIGHQYSTVALGLEAEVGLSASWVLPLLTERVATDQDKELVGAEQIAHLLDDPQLPFGRELTVEVVDSSYSKPAYLHRHRHYPQLVTIARSRSNRTYYQQPVPTAEAGAARRRGHPTWYGERFALSEPTTWDEPDETHRFWETSRRGQAYKVEMQAWHNRLMPGKQQPEPLPMQQYPFTLVRIVRYDQEGKSAFKQPLWLIVMGQRRTELTLEQIYHAYAVRFDIEHFFRFGKQKLLLVAFQTPEVTREENWMQLAHIAYAQLWMARHLVDWLPRPWERNLPAFRRQCRSPTLVQRDFARIIRQIGTPAQPPKPRGISPGRRKGTKLPRRPAQKVVVKGQSISKAA